VEAIALPDDVRRRFDAWLAAEIEREKPLGVREIRQGVRALSALYVEERGRGELARRAVGGAARRAALATYYAPLHFLVAFAAGAALLGARPAPRRVLDLGCGTGAAGAAAALATDGAAAVLAVDRSPWALGRARRTYAAFGLAARTRRGALPAALPGLRAGDLAVLGWAVNELGAEARAHLLSALARGVARGARLLLLEPLAAAASPWWDEAAARLATAGVRATLFKRALERPAWIETLDAAAGLDHRTLGARVLAGPAA
jgi:SAM-dependent methyltransferase